MIARLSPSSTLSRWSERLDSVRNEESTTSHCLREQQSLRNTSQRNVSLLTSTLSISPTLSPALSLLHTLSSPLFAYIYAATYAPVVCMEGGMTGDLDGDFGEVRGWRERERLELSMGRFPSEVIPECTIYSNTQVAELIPKQIVRN